MPWGEEAEQGLPPRHHREPTGLRRDIIDELTDPSGLRRGSGSRRGA